MIFLVFASFIASNSCPDQWKRYLNKCYYTRSYDEATFYKNYELCKSINAEMLDIQTYEENQFVWRLLGMEYCTLCTSKEAWLGGIRIDFINNQELRWLNWSNFTYKNADYNFGSNCNTDCCAMYMTTSGRWQGINCDEKKVQICQINGMIINVIIF